MSSPLRIPPGVDFAFEKRVNAVLETAKPDYDRLPTLRTELLEHLRARWREGIEKNLSTEAAEERALELFGDPEATGKSLRESWWRRILFYKRCSAERYLVFCTAYLVANYLLNAVTLLEMEGRIMDSRHMSLLIENFAYSLNIIPAAISLHVLKLKKPKRYRLLYYVWLARHLLWIFPLVFVFNLVAIPPLSLMDVLEGNSLSLALIIVTVIYSLSLLLCLFAALCYGKEVKDTISSLRRS